MSRIESWLSHHKTDAHEHGYVLKGVMCAVDFQDHLMKVAKGAALGKGGKTVEYLDVVFRFDKRLPHGNVLFRWVAKGLDEKKAK